MAEIWQFDLRKGAGHDPREGACLLDAVSWFEYGRLGDHPACVCPVLAAFGRGINDVMSDAARQKLKVFIPRLVETVDPTAERARAEFLVWQAIRVFAPIKLRAVGHHDLATKLENFMGTLKEACIASAAYTAYAASAAAASATTWGAYTASAAYAATAASAAASAAAVNTESVALIEAACIDAFDNVLKIGKQALPIDAMRIEKANTTFSLACA